MPPKHYLEELEKLSLIKISYEPDDKYSDEWYWVDGADSNRNVRQDTKWVLYEYIPSLSGDQEKSLDSEAITKEPVKWDRAAILKGDMWDVSFDGNQAFLKDLPRIRYIWRLLESPNTEFFHIGLQTLVSGKQPKLDEDYKKMSSEKLQKEGFTDNFEDIMLDTLQDHDKKGLQKIIYDCWSDLLIRP